MAKWIVGTIFFNEKDFIIPSIKSVYDFADKIILVEGKDKVFESSHINGLSSDGSTELVKEFIEKEDKDHKIVYIPLGLVNSKKELRQAYLDYAQKNYDENAWILVLDADEGYHEKTLKLLDRYVDGDQNLQIILNDQFWFWSPAQVACKNSIEIEYPEVAVPGFTMKSTDKYCCDRSVQLAYHGYFDERIFRNLEGLSYNKSHTNVCDSSGEFLYSQDKYRENRNFITNSWANRFHYGYLKSERETESKLKYYLSRDGQLISKDNNIGDSVKNSPFFWWKHNGRPEGIIIPGSKPGLIVMSFEGEHPKSFANHPLLRDQI